MNKNFKVVELSGLSGLLILVFVLTSLFCGFILFPIWILMTLWNYIVGNMMHGAVINYFQSALLWIAIILSFYLLTQYSVSIKIQQEEFSENTDIKEIIGEISEKHDDKQ